MTWARIAAKVLLLAGLWMLLGRPKWTGWHIAGGVLFMMALDWIIELALEAAKQP